VGAQDQRDRCVGIWQKRKMAVSQRRRKETACFSGVREEPHGLPGMLECNWFRAILGLCFFFSEALDQLENLFTC
jgi:hypothetical protein